MSLFKTDRKLYYRLRWRKAYKENPRPFILNNARYRIKLKEKIFAVLGKKCSKCSFDNPLALQIDHINGGGKKETAVLGTTNTYYKEVLRSISCGEKKYQILCANCNWIKRYENKECKILSPESC